MLWIALLMVHHGVVNGHVLREAKRIDAETNNANVSSKACCSATPAQYASPLRKRCAMVIAGMGLNCGTMCPLHNNQKHTKVRAGSARGSVATMQTTCEQTHLPFTVKNAKSSSYSVT